MAAAAARRRHKAQSPFSFPSCRLPSLRYPTYLFLAMPSRRPYGGTTLSLSRLPPFTPSRPMGALLTKTWTANEGAPNPTLSVSIYKHKAKCLSGSKPLSYQSMVFRLWVFIDGSKKRGIFAGNFYHSLDLLIGRAPVLKAYRFNWLWIVSLREVAAHFYIFPDRRRRMHVKQK